MPPKKVKAGIGRSQSEVFHADPQKVATAIAAAVAALQEVEFALAWIPDKNSTIFVRSVTANGSEQLPNGAQQQNSPFYVSLGKYPAGQLTVSWSVIAFSDLTGIKAFTKAATASEWKELSKKEPLKDHQAWDDKAGYQVP